MNCSFSLSVSFCFSFLHSYKSVLQVKPQTKVARDLMVPFPQWHGVSRKLVLSTNTAPLMPSCFFPPASWPKRQSRQIVKTTGNVYRRSLHRCLFSPSFSCWCASDLELNKLGMYGQQVIGNSSFSWSLSFYYFSFLPPSYMFRIL